MTGPGGGFSVRTSERLAPAQAHAVRDLAAAVEGFDGVPALSEAFRLALEAAPPGTGHVLVGPNDDPTVTVGYAQWQPGAAHPGAELLVHPDHRRRGVGTALLAALPPAARVWSHGPAAPATEFAAAAGLTPVRRLHLMTRLAGPAGPANGPLPDGLIVRPFEPGRDEPEWLAANADAFAGHPEQGRLTAADLAARMAQPWFDPAGFLLAVPSADPARIAAFHWTKIDPPGGPEGEVYAIGVRPAYQGRGLGAPLLGHGLAYLTGRGVRTVRLYVEADNAPALALYRRHGFVVVATDTMYALLPRRQVLPRSRP